MSAPDADEISSHSPHIINFCSNFCPVSVSMNVRVSCLSPSAKLRPSGAQHSETASPSCYRKASDDEIGKLERSLVRRLWGVSCCCPFCPTSRTAAESRGNLATDKDEG
ncbi:hypothetical protein BV898_10499 [Hypsibius exemplaris]|uniref:Uncharacterized protein n=1 Tax=Hypsibius exemplaris TaxID=2072580 RepID=A0A1W0WJ80_HYPEX|nr:hypothetical protein BV898_10499 [Hypsibius exemplaris]